MPLLWAPVIAAGAAWCLRRAGGATEYAAVVAQAAAGLLLWQLAEYSLHRWVGRQMLVSATSGIHLQLYSIKKWEQQDAAVGMLCRDAVAISRLTCLQVFHRIPANPAGIVAHFALHGCHHKFPKARSLPTHHVGDFFSFLRHGCSCNDSLPSTSAKVDGLARDSQDAGRLVFPPLPAFVVASAVFGLLRLLLHQVASNEMQRLQFNMSNPL